MRPFTKNVAVPDIGSADLTERAVRFAQTRGSIEVVRFRLWPLLRNTDIVVVGDHAIAADVDGDADDAQGIVVWPGVKPTEWIESPDGSPMDLYDWWVDARVALEGVMLFGFLAERGT